MEAIAQEKPLLGQPLQQALAWRRPVRSGRLLLRCGQPRAQVGPGVGNDSLRIAHVTHVMKKKTLLDVLQERALLGDGAMGTQLMLAGLEQGSCGEAWNLTHPDKVLAIQRRYADAGSDCILTNTFGGSRIMLNRHGNAGKVAEINKAAVEIAREAFAAAADS